MCIRDSISEGFEDAHYFFDLKSLLNDHHHDHDEEEHGHEHSDLPNQLLKILFSPLFLLASIWHYYAQSSKTETKTWSECYDIMQGKAPEHEHHHESPTFSKEHSRAQAVVLVQEQVERLEQSSLSLELTQAKIKILQGLIELLSTPELNKEKIKQTLENPELKVHRFSLFSCGKTTTETAMEEVASLVATLG